MAILHSMKTFPLNQIPNFNSVVSASTNEISIVGCDCDCLYTIYFRLSSGGCIQVTLVSFHEEMDTSHVFDTPDLYWSIIRSSDKILVVRWRGKHSYFAWHLFFVVRAYHSVLLHLRIHKVTNSWAALETVI